MPGTLYVVATPIGNLEDFTLRAIRVLQEVHLIAAEDTRRTAILLRHYSISTPTTSFHAHNEQQKQAPLLAKLEQGQLLALVSDAGTPTLSDPGTRLIAAAHTRGIRVEAVPGASAILAALVSSGMTTDQFLFAGFPPSRAKDRTAWLERLTDEPRPIVMFESPHRILKLLVHMKDVFGDRDISLGRELTKKHEELVKGPISFVINKLKSIKGEFTLVISPSIPDRRKNSSVDKMLIYKEFCHLTDQKDLMRREAVLRLSRRHGMSSKTVYKAIEEAKKAID